MKKYTIKNYKGNIVESLTKFQAKYKNVRVVEATEEDGKLKLKCEENNNNFYKLILPVETIIQNCNFSNCFKYGEAFFDMCDYSMDPIDWDLYEDQTKKNIDENVIEDDLYFLYFTRNGVLTISKGKYVSDDSLILFFGDESDCIIYAAFCPDIKDKDIEKIDIQSGRYEDASNAIKNMKAFNFSHGDKKDASFYSKSKEIIGKIRTR